jgi:hypothetical protein
MDGLRIQLIARLDRDKAHILALDGFGDRLGIHERAFGPWKMNELALG